MNRSILIVICDFLLVSLLLFSSVDVNKVTEEGTAQTPAPTLAPPPDNQAELAAVMRQALDEERRSRDQLLGQLEQVRETVDRQQVLLSDRERQAQALQTELQLSRQELESREQQAATLQQELQSREQEAARLQQQQNTLEQQFAAAQTNLQGLNRQLQSTSTDAVISREKAAALEAELRKQNEEAAALQQQLALLATSNQVVLAEKQRLAGDLRVAEVEKQHATERAARMQEQVEVERAEKARLAQGVQALASRSDQLVEEIRENRPLTPNAIFDDFLANRVQASFTAIRSGFFGANRQRETSTVLATDGTNTYALCHVQDTPLALWNPGTDWDSLLGALSHKSAAVPIRSLSFSWPDPRAVWMPVDKAELRRFDAKVYPISSDPFKFQDAVLVGAREGYYGECRFEIDITTPGYVKLDRSVLKGLFGKFNPSQGDLVFSRTGDLLGIMANNTYCMMIRNFDSTATIQFGNDVRAQQTGETLSRLHFFVAQLPAKLQ